MKHILALFIFLSTSASALEFTRMNIYHNGNGWRARTPTLFLQLVPQSEEVADALLTLNPAKKYRCEVKAYDQDWALPITPVFAIQNCMEK